MTAWETFQAIVACYILLLIAGVLAANLWDLLEGE